VKTLKGEQLLGHVRRARAGPRDRGAGAPRDGRGRAPRHRDRTERDARGDAAAASRGRPPHYLEPDRPSRSRPRAFFCARRGHVVPQTDTSPPLASGTCAATFTGSETEARPTPGGSSDNSPAACGAFTWSAFQAMPLNSIPTRASGSLPRACSPTAARATVPNSSPASPRRCRRSPKPQEPARVHPSHRAPILCALMMLSLHSAP
jgi:hypothetical protein